jgi:hypothetical protein
MADLLGRGNLMTELITEPGARCKFCGSPLLIERATICHVCRSWQKRWLNYLVFLGGSAGVLALLATAITYVGNTIYTTLSQRTDAQILQLQYPGHQLYDNSGTTPILLSYLEFYWKGGGYSAVIVGGKALEAKQMYYNNDDVSKLENVSPKPTFLANKSGDGTSLLPESLPYPYTDRCYSMVFFSAEAPELGQLNSYFAEGKVKLATINLNEAYLYYYSTNDAVLHSRQFPAIAAFLDLKKKECAKPTAAER